MTVQSKTAARPNSVTTGAIAGSRKIYTSPAGRPDINVPFREIALDPSAREEPYRAYDCSGPYTDPSVTIDLEAGLPPVRAEWLAKRGFERIAARAGAADRQRRRVRRPSGSGLSGGASGIWRQAGPACYTDRIRPRRHCHRRNDLCRAPGESRPAEDARRRRGTAGRWRKLRCGNPSVHHAGVRARAKSRAAAPSSRPTSTIRSWSRSSSAATSW